MIADGKRHVAAVDIGHQRADRILHFRAQEAFEPLGVFLGQNEAVFLDAIYASRFYRNLLVAGAEQFQRTCGGGHLDFAFIKANLFRPD